VAKRGHQGTGEMRNFEPGDCRNSSWYYFYESHGRRKNYQSNIRPTRYTYDCRCAITCAIWKGGSRFEKTVKRQIGLLRAGRGDDLETMQLETTEEISYLVSKYVPVEATVVSDPVKMLI
jgi:hypothetical protein